MSAPKRAASTISSLEPLRDVVQHWLDAGVQGRAIHAALMREHGYTGSYSAVVRILRRLRQARPAQATVRLDFAAGQAAQVDFGAGPLLLHPDDRQRRTWAFVMTLAYSRHQYVEFVWDQSVATWLGCHRRALEWFGAVPVRVIVDNAKCAVIKACRHDPLIERAYAECAQGYGFKIEACPPHDPQKKGIVESGVKYLKYNFLPTRQFRNLADLNSQVRTWVINEAGRRKHGSTHQQLLIAVRA
jgi:transposase